MMDLAFLSQLYIMADLLARCPGMKKEDVYYLEHRGYVKPIKQRHGRLQRNLYTKEQIELVCAVWHHRQTGLAPRQAYQQALKECSAGQLSIWPEREQ